MTIGKRKVTVIHFIQDSEDAVPGVIVVDGKLPEKSWDELNDMLKKGKIGHQPDIVAFLEKEGKVVLFDNFERGDEVRYLNAGWRYC